MSLIDLGKNDISEETQALKDRLASRDTENAGLRTQLMRREAELGELQATFNETVYKLSKEAERALRLEEEVSARSSELKIERISLQNTELALQSAQANLKAEEHAKRELESTLDTVSLHSQVANAEHQSVQRDKRALESRVRELERIVQTHEAKVVSNIPRKNGRPRSSSVTNFRLPTLEKELSDAKAQLHMRDTSSRVLEQKLAQAQDDLVKAENARISIDKASQKRISELLSTLEKKEEELETLRETDSAGEREEELVKRIDEDAAKIAALEKLVVESQSSRTSQSRIQKLQNQLKEEVHRSEELQNRLFQEKEELVRQYEGSRREVAENQELLIARECQIKDLEARHAHLLTELGAQKESPSIDEHPTSQPQGLNDVSAFPNESALADQLQILLQAIDRLRDERDALKRALEFSEVEYRITTESFQARIASLTRQLADSAHDISTDKCNTRMEQRMKQLTSRAVAFTVVISNLQTRLDLSANRLSVTSADLTSSNSQLHDTLAIIDSQRQLLATNTHEHDCLIQKFDAVARELTESDEERNRLRLQLTDVEGQVATAVERAETAEAAREEIHQSFLLAEQRLVTLNKDRQEVESQRNSLALQVANLQDDFGRLQEDLADARNRYNALHAQQMSAVSTTEVVRTLKEHVKELEARVIHSADQIGDYQHDIRRLEANVKLHEERIADMTSELELLASEKEAMVEDCAEAREARDKARDRLEAAEDEAEQVQQQLQQAKDAYETELSAMSSTVVDLTTENQMTAARLANLEAENAGFIRELESLSRDHHHLSEQLNAVTSRLWTLQLENSQVNAEMQQAVVSLAVIHCAYKECAQQLRRSYQHTASLESQLVTIGQEPEQDCALIDNVEKETYGLFQQLSDLPAVAVSSRDDPTPRSRRQMATEESTNTYAALWQQEQAQLDDRSVGSLRNSLQAKELELVTTRQLLEEKESRYAEVEADLLKRIATMTVELQAQKGQATDIPSLRAENQNVRTQLQNSLENFADLEKLHRDVIQDFLAGKQVFERRLTESDEQIRTLEAEHQRSLTTLETKYRNETDILTSDLEDREHEVEELRQQLQDLSEAHTRAEEKLYTELKSHEASQAHANDPEKDLRRTIVNMRQNLAEAEAEALALREERLLLQSQISDLQAEIQRSISLTQYLENQVRESEDACMLLKESLQQSELNLAVSEKAGKATEFNFSLQVTQHEEVVAALRREIVSLQPRPESRSALADLEEKNREMDDLLRAKCQEIEGYDDRILETLKANKKLTSKVESLARKVQALQTKLSLVKSQHQELVAEAVPPKRESPASCSHISDPAALCAGNHPSSSHSLESSPTSVTLRSKTPEQSIAPPPLSRTPGRTSGSSGCDMSAGKKRPAPDDDERDSVPAEGHYSADACFRNGPTPRLRRAHGNPAGFTPVRGASARKPAGLPPPGRRANAGMMPSEVITDVTNSPRGDAQTKKRSWLGKIRGGTGSQTASARLGTLGGQ